MKSAGKARSNGLYRHIRTSKEIIRNLLNDLLKKQRTLLSPLRRTAHRNARRPSVDGARVRAETQYSLGFAEKFSKNLLLAIAVSAEDVI